jgi:hypothetical protein
MTLLAGVFVAVCTRKCAESQLQFVELVAVIFVSRKGEQGGLSVMNVLLGNVDLFLCRCYDPA